MVDEIGSNSQNSDNDEEQSYQKKIQFLQKMKEMPIKKVHQVMQQYIEVFKQALSDLDYEIDYFRVKQKSEFSDRNVESEIVDLRYENYVRKYKQKLNELVRRTIQIEKVNHQNQNDFQYNKSFITNADVDINSIRSKEMKIVDQRLKKRGISENQLSKIDYGEIQEVIQKRKNQMTQLINYQQQILVDKIKVNDNQKNYYKKLESKYEQISQKFRLKNQSLEKKIKHKQKEHENKQIIINDIKKDQKMKQNQLKKDLDQRINIHLQRNQQALIENHQKIKEFNIEDDRKQQQTMINRNIIQEEYDQNVEIILEKEQEDEINVESNNQSRFDRSIISKHKLDEKIRKANQQSTLEKQKYEKEQIYKQIDKTQKKDIRIQNQVFIKQKMMSERKSLKNQKIKQLQNNLNLNGEQLQKRAKKIKEQRKFKEQTKQQIDDQIELNRKIRKEMNIIRQQNQTEIYQENMKKEEQKREKDLEVIQEYKNKCQSIVEKRRIVKEIKEKTIQQIQDQKQMMNQMVQNVDRVLKSQNDQQEVQKIYQQCRLATRAT